MSRLFFTDGAVGSIQDNGISESVVQDVFDTGTSGVNENGERFAVKKYSGNEIEIT